MWCTKETPVAEPTVKEANKARAEAYAKAVGMNQANTKMAVVMATQGPDAAAKAMMEESGGDYAAMRMRYG
jgi:hypothetical protein